LIPTHAKPLESLFNTLDVFDDTLDLIAPESILQLGEAQTGPHRSPMLKSLLAINSDMEKMYEIVDTGLVTEAALNTISNLCLTCVQDVARLQIQGRSTSGDSPDKSICAAIAQHHKNVAFVWSALFANILNGSKQRLSDKEIEFLDIEGLKAHFSLLAKTAPFIQARDDLEDFFIDLVAGVAGGYQPSNIVIANAAAQGVSQEQIWEQLHKLPAGGYSLNDIDTLTNGAVGLTVGQMQHTVQRLPDCLSGLYQWAIDQTIQHKYPISTNGLPHAITYGPWIGDIHDRQRELAYLRVDGFDSAQRDRLLAHLRRIDSNPQKGNTALHTIGKGFYLSCPETILAGIPDRHLIPTQSYAIKVERDLAQMEGPELF
jgi:hypothetical protein